MGMESKVGKIRTTQPKSQAKPTEGHHEQTVKKGKYKFCPLLHRLSILWLLEKHLCQHPLLPERHGQSRTPQQIYHDSIHEMYLHCKNNELQEVWAYLWTNWYAPDKWKLCAL